ncbi:MAG TPA: hypothetical protein VGQ82_12120 [Chthoniobacterales bacterium]|nr:hypothetical protein [Chthoniobacterales bacterium]
MTDGGGKRESQASDPAEAAAMLELESIQRRAAWQRISARRSALLTGSLLFLFAVIAAGLCAFYFFVSSGRVEELRASQTAHSSPSPPAGHR